MATDGKSIRATKVVRLANGFLWGPPYDQPTMTFAISFPTKTAVAKQAAASKTSVAATA
jgi:hypothetical protein